MIETICYSIALVLVALIMFVFGMYSYHLGRKDGINQAIIDVCKKENIVKEYTKGN